MIRGCAQTIEAINRPPHAGGLATEGLILRYNTASGIDDLTGDEGTFNLCTFWLVEALTRAGQLDDAQFTFEQMLQPGQPRRPVRRRNWLQRAGPRQLSAGP